MPQGCTQRFCIQEVHQYSALPEFRLQGFFLNELMKMISCGWEKLLPHKMEKFVDNIHTLT